MDMESRSSSANMFDEPPLLEEYRTAHIYTLSPARRGTLRFSQEVGTPQLPPIIPRFGLWPMVEKALMTITRCTSPPTELLHGPQRGCRIEMLPPALIEMVISYLAADDLAMVAVASHCLKDCVPAAAVLSAKRAGFELPLKGPRITRRLHTCEMQAWLARRVMTQLGSGNRRTREVAVLRCASLPIQCVAQHAEVLLEHSGSFDAMVRLRALRTLSHLTMKQKERMLKEHPEAVTKVLPRLEDEDALVRRAAVNVLGGWLVIGVWPTDSTQDLMEEISEAVHRRSLCDENECVRAASERLLLTHREQVPMCT